MKPLPIILVSVLQFAAGCDRFSPDASAPAADADGARPAREARPAPPHSESSSTTTARASTRVAVTRPATSAATTRPAATQDASGDRAKLYGTWVARDVDASMGDVKIRLTFHKKGPVQILAWSELPLVGQVRNKEADYEVQGNTISSDALRGGTSVNYRFDGDDLIIEYKDGKSVRFTRAT